MCVCVCGVETDANLDWWLRLDEASCIQEKVEENWSVKSRPPSARTRFLVRCSLLPLLWVGVSECLSQYINA